MVAEHDMKKILLLLLIAPLALSLTNCSTINAGEEGPVYPMYTDQNSDGVNDYVAPSTHESGPVSSGGIAHGMGPGFGSTGHGFVDDNGDGICDYAQNGSPTWHGPGFNDNNDNGICDHWDSSADLSRSHQGMRYRDENGNQVNDFMEQSMHMGNNHEFIDEGGDGICDYAQDGSPTWHGPGFIDADQNGICDYWQSGGRGHGGMGGGGHHR